MKNYGFVKVGAAVPEVRVADVEFNVAQVKRLIDRALKEEVEIVCFPELCITGYSCQDLFRNATLLDKAEAALEELSEYTSDKPIVVIVGAPTRQVNRLMNSAAVMAGGVYHLVHKTYIPNYNEFYEKRWFAAEDVESPPMVFELTSGVKFAVEICEDLWAPIPPSSFATLAGADIVFNLSATDELLSKHQYLLSLLSGQSARCMAGYVYSSAGFGESTQDVVYGGNGIVYENGRLLAHSKRFSTQPQLITAQIDVERLRAERMDNTTFGDQQRAIAEDSMYIPLEVEPSEREFRLERDYLPHPFIPTGEDMEASCREIFSIQLMGLAKRLSHTDCHDVVLGISGGLDSTLALLVCVATFDKLGLDRRGIHGITMPGFGTSTRTHTNAVALMHSLGISQQEIDITPAVEQHFSDIAQDKELHDVTYENSQARYRTMLLMDLANKLGALVIGTGDLSELALGWCTYNGDHISMYNVNVSIPKTLVRYLVRFVALGTKDETTRSTLLDIIDTPISPELIPTDKEGHINQKTEDILGPYELHDFFLYHFMRFGFTREKILLLAEKAFSGTHGPHYTREAIEKALDTFLRRFFSQQFKRSCLPDGPKVGSVSLSPRGDWRMASDASVKGWLKK